MPMQFTPVSGGTAPSGGGMQFTPVGQQVGTGGGGGMQFTPVDNGGQAAPMSNPGSYTSKYEKQIVQMALKYGVRPSAALAIHRIEDASDSPTIQDYNKSDHIGEFQMSQDAWKDAGMGNADRRDPLKNIEGGVKYLRNLVSQNHGDYEAAIHHFGDGTPQYLAQYNAYAQEYDDVKLADKHSTDPTGHPVEGGFDKPIGAVLNDKRSLTHVVDKALPAAATAGRHFIAQAHEITKDHPSFIQHVSDFMSTLQRGAAGTREYIDQHHLENGGVFVHPEQWKGLVEQTGNWALHPSKQEDANKVDRNALAIGNGGFIPTDSQINAHLHGLAATVARASADTLAQGLMDPAAIIPFEKGFELFGKLAPKAIEMIAPHITGPMNHLTAQALIAHKLFGGDPKIVNIINETKKGVANVFAKRPDLDQHFSPEGKKAFLGVLGGQLNAHAERIDVFRKADVSKMANIATPLVNMAFEHGDNAMRQAILNSKYRGSLSAGVAATKSGTGAWHITPAKFNNLVNDLKSKNAEERIEELTKASDSIVKNHVQATAKDFSKVMGTHTIRGANGQPVTQQFEKFLSPAARDILGTGGQAAWETVASKIPHDVTTPIAAMLNKSWWGGITNMSRAATTTVLAYANPLLHPVKNVGELSFMRAPGSVAGGSHAVITGLLHGLSMGRFVEPGQLKRMQQIGARSKYYSDIIKNTNNPVGRVWNYARDLGTHVEDGYRAAMLAQLDRKLGPSAHPLEEYLKGQIVNERAGDYHNLSAFVQTMRAIGGPFVAFRLGIVPEQMFKSLVNPSRLNAKYRFEINANDENRKGKGTGLWQDLGGPGSDIAELGSNPGKYLSSPATTGIIGSAVGNTSGTGILQNATKHSLTQTLMDTAFLMIDMLYPGVGAAINLAGKNPDYDADPNQNVPEGFAARESGIHGIRYESKMARKSQERALDR